MSQRSRDVRAELWRISDALAASWEDAPQAEIEEDFVKAGPEAKTAAENLRRLLLEKERQWRKAQLSTARQSHSIAVAELITSSVSLPESPEARRQLLSGLLAARPDIQPALTMQFRDYSTLSEADVESLLRQLAALGIELGEPK